jgi:hypothetical protein
MISKFSIIIFCGRLQFHYIVLLPSVYGEGGGSTQMNVINGLTEKLLGSVETNK